MSYEGKFDIKSPALRELVDLLSAYELDYQKIDDLLSTNDIVNKTFPIDGGEKWSRRHLCPIVMAILRCDLKLIKLLVSHGASILPQEPERRHLLETVCKIPDLRLKPEAIDIARFFLDAGIPKPSQVSLVTFPIAEAGRFDILLLLEEHGYETVDLKLTPLIYTVIYGNLADLKIALESRPNTMERCASRRTPLTYALLQGDLEKAKMLLEAGALLVTDDASDVLQTGSMASVIFYLTAGKTVVDEEEATDELYWKAVNETDTREDFTDDIIYISEKVKTRRMAAFLTRLSGSVDRINAETRRLLLSPVPWLDSTLDGITQSEFASSCTPRFPLSNPTEFHDRYYKRMAKIRWDAHWAADHFGVKPVRFKKQKPVWCTQRSGQSLTFLPDGRAIEIGGQREDYCDAHAYVYNDVIVHEPNGEIRIFGYPRSAFPPTDYHSATLVGDFIYIFGCAGHMQVRTDLLHTFYRLNTKTYQIEQLPMKGDNPGRISGHQAKVVEGAKIEIWGGFRILAESRHQRMKDRYLFDIQTWEWTKIG